METIQIIYPLIAQIVLTLAIGLWLGVLRFKAVKQGDLSPRFYELNRGGKMPEYLAKVSQNYDNLFELPILFYVLCLALYVTAEVNTLQITLAWLFVASRMLHSYEHTRRNHLRSRMRWFMLGVLCVIGMTIVFILNLVF